MSARAGDRRLVLAAAGLRSLATGLIAPLLGFYLAALSFDERTIGLVISAGLAGAALATAAVTFLGRRVSRRAALLGQAALSVAGGGAVALASGPLVVAGAAFVGMVNGMGRDRGAALVVEQAMLPELASDAERTHAFARFSVVQDAGVAMGSLLAAVPGILRAATGLPPLPALRASLVLYLALVALSAVPYFLLSPHVAAARTGAGLRVSQASRGVLARICGLFAIDSVAGGFLTTTFLTVFFHVRFGADERAIALLLFARSVLNALSHLAAAGIARRCGLLNTMVFTHLPSSVLLITVTIAPDFGVAAALFLLREAVVEMDVPTRTSYVLAVVEPHERTLASGLTHLVRMGGWAISPALAGALVGPAGSLALPLWIGAGMKIVYDVLLLAAFRGVAPPEERRGGPAPP